MLNEGREVLKKILIGLLKMHFQCFLFIPRSIAVSNLRDYYISKLVFSHLRRYLEWWNHYFAFRFCFPHELQQYHCSGSMRWLMEY